MILVVVERCLKVKETGAEVEDVGGLKLEEAGKGGGGQEKLEEGQQARVHALMQRRPGVPL